MNPVTCKHGLPAVSSCAACADEALSFVAVDKETERLRREHPEEGSHPWVDENDEPTPPTNLCFFCTLADGTTRPANHEGRHGAVAETPEGPRTFTVTLTPLQMQALMAFSNITDPEPCFDHEDGQHGDFNECMGYAPEFEAAVWEAFELIGRAYGATPDPRPCSCGHPVREHQVGEGPWTGFCADVDCKCERPTPVEAAA